MPPERLIPDQHRFGSGTFKVGDHLAVIAPAGEASGGGLVVRSMHLATPSPRPRAIKTRPFAQPPFRSCRGEVVFAIKAARVNHAPAAVHRK